MRSKTLWLSRLLSSLRFRL